MDRPFLQVRVWDTMNGTLNTWEQASTAFFGSQDLGGIGVSDLFQVAFPLGGTDNGNGPPNMQGLQSFNIIYVGHVPEPSVIALGVVGAACVLLMRRRQGTAR
jgi:hypothetical protein